MANSTCSLKGCFNKQNTEVTLFKIPRNQNIREKWLEFLRSNGNENVRDDATYRLCQEHFSRNSICVANGKKSLTPGSIPSMILLSSVSLTFYVGLFHHFCHD